MKIKTLSAAILCAASTQAVADNEYWVGSDGEYARDRNGHCIRTIKWTAEAAIPGCEGIEEKKVVKEKTKVTPAPAPAPVVAAPAAKPAEPVYTTVNLASGTSFKTGGSTLSAEGKAAVAELVTKFKGKADSVVIEGHTDDTGDADFNQQLSEKRAEAVKAEAVANGAKADKIETVGYGESKPVADNGTREGRAKNRRVEIKVELKELQQ